MSDANATPAYAVDDEVIFNGYEELEEGQPEIFSKGTRLRITGITPEGDYLVVSVDDGEVGDTVFADEIRATDVDEADEVEAEAEAVEKAVESDPAPEQADAFESEEAVETPEPTVDIAPAAAELAEKESIDVTELSGTGKGGKIVKKDVQAAVKARNAAAEEVEPGEVQPKTKAEQNAKAKKAEEQVDEPEAESAPATGVAEAEKTVPATTNAVMTSTDGEALLASAVQLVNKVEESCFVLGGILRQIQNQKVYTLHYEDNDGKGFKEYVAEELGLHYRKAMYYMAIHQFFEGFGYDETTLAGIGWSKAKEIARIDPESVDGEEVENLIEYARDHTKQEVIDHVKSEYVDTDTSGESESTVGGKSQKTNFKFSLFDDQGSFVQDALETVMKQNDLSDHNSAFHLIVTEHAQLSENMEVPLESAIEALEQKHGIKLDIVKQDT